MDLNTVPRKLQDRHYPWQAGITLARPKAQRSEGGQGKEK